MITALMLTVLILDMALQVLGLAASNPLEGDWL